MTTTANKIYEDAPIRQSVPEYSICRHCTKILQVCKGYKIRKGIKDGFVVIEHCSGFEDYRGLEP